MFLPIGHDRSVSRFPWLTLALIGISTLVQLYSTLFAPGRAELEGFVETLRFARSDADLAAVQIQAQELLDSIPIVRWGYVTGSGLDYRLITSGFVHDGWIHLIGNMLFLWLAGAALEDRLGRIRWGILYLAGEAVATWSFEATYSGSPVILVGASGAVSAAMGAFLVYFARTEITIWYFIMFRTGTFRMAAYFALPLWLADQVLTVLLFGGTPGLERVAYAAHFGGFAFGLVTAGIATYFFGGGGSAEEEPSAAESIELSRDAQLDARFQRCFEALRARDLGELRNLASRTVIDLERAGDYDRIAELHHAILGSEMAVPYTDKALRAVTIALTRR